MAKSAKKGIVATCKAFFKKTTNPGLEPRAVAPKYGISAHRPRNFSNWREFLRILSFKKKVVAQEYEDYNLIWFYNLIKSL